MLEETVGYEQGPMPEFKSSPMAAFQAIWDSHNRVNNLLWLTICSVATSFIIGNIAILGYGSDVLKARSGRPEHPNQDVDPERLGDYLSNGLWPFLVSFVIQFAVGALISVPFGIMVFVASLLLGDAAPVVFLLSFPLMIILSIVISIYSVPFVLRCMICQDFAQAFDLGWARTFVGLMWKEMVSSGIAFMLLAIVLNLFGVLACGIGLFVTNGITMGAAMHLLAQWYEIYLSRGGEPVLSPGS
ncbi:MAG: DUF4013 domain-containing protein [Planctomycetota bacterium]